MDSEVLRLLAKHLGRFLSIGKVLQTNCAMCADHLESLDTMLAAAENTLRRISEWWAV